MMARFGSIRFSALLLLCGLLMGCSLGRPSENSVATSTATIAPDPTRVQRAMTREASAAEPIVFASPLPSQTPLPASMTPTSTPLLGPYEYEIKGGDTLGYIIRQFGYRPNDGFVMNLVVELNRNVPNVDALPGPGSIIYIPRPTATPLPIGVELTATADAELGTITLGGITLPAGTDLVCHEVRGGETIIDISARYGMTVEIIASLNRNLDFSGCDLTQPGGGGECNVFISEGQCVTVAGPTAVPTFTATPSGDETATPEPSPAPPQIIAPVDGAQFAATNSPRLYWWSRPILPDEVYLVVMYEEARNLELTRVVRANALFLPREFAPAAGETRTISWSVRIVRKTAEGTYAFVSEFAPTQVFHWTGG
ncbi:MAG: LysM domain-containing protein [Anaerolineaceae bacterium]|nr:LysM domain-containing protein [Anaerolineaceae bacterium]